MVLTHKNFAVARLVAVLLLLWLAIFRAAAANTPPVANPGWVGLSVVIFPVGSAAALILLHWFNEEARAPTVVPHG